MGFEDFFGGGDNQWQIILPLIIFVIFAMFMRRRKAERTDTEVASSLLMDIHENLKVVESFGYQKKPKKFKVGSWQRNSSKLGFLEPALLTDLTEAFNLAENFNQQIDMARKQKSDIYLSGLDVHKVEGPLTKSRDGLQKWLKARMQQAGPEAGRRGCMPGGLGM